MTMAGTWRIILGFAMAPAWTAGVQRRVLCCPLVHSTSFHTPLHEAAFNGDVALGRLLLERGADRSLRTGDGQTALEIASANGREEIVRLLRD